MGRVVCPDKMRSLVGDQNGKNKGIRKAKYLVILQRTYMYKWDILVQANDF